MTTLLDLHACPAEQIAALYAERRQAELVYKSIKSTLRGGDRRLRGQSPDLAEQEIWALLTVYNALVGNAVQTAVDLGIDPDEISFTAVLRGPAHAGWDGDAKVGTCEFLVLCLLRSSPVGLSPDAAVTSRSTSTSSATP
ncbi:transposase [Micromonosporaceae bacterium Da 78-11]